MTFGSTLVGGASAECVTHLPLPRQRCLENGGHPPRSPFSNSRVCVFQGVSFPSVSTLVRSATIGTTGPAAPPWVGACLIAPPPLGCAGTEGHRGSRAWRCSDCWCSRPHVI